MDEQILQLSAKLAEAAARNTASGIANRIRVIRDRKETRETIGQLEEIINDLIADKNELVQIAQAFEQDLVAQRITPQQAQSLVSSLAPALERLAGSGGGQQAKAALEPLIGILTPEVIDALQLLGFNFRQAIGEPLTDLLADFLRSKGGRPNATPPRRQSK